MPRKFKNGDLAQCVITKAIGTITDYGNGRYLFVVSNKELAKIHPALRADFPYAYVVNDIMGGGGWFLPNRLIPHKFNDGLDNWI